ncbi:hypothetical protein BDV59DRAFT_199488 [Aspergillus ambiguus]|uniref:uncharacterized protein n=1 Tax=Aspergillus ambiguus TaxID=176160 RepID=UPI003CCD4B40
MPTLSGIYTSSSGQVLGINDQDELIVLPSGHEPASLRTDAEFWLCRGDGSAGKFGDPSKVRLRSQGEEYHIWVETRGFSDGSNEYGLVVIPPGQEYSNRFLAVNKRGELEILDSWTDEAKFRCVE